MKKNRQISLNATPHLKRKVLITCKSFHFGEIQIDKAVPSVKDAPHYRIFDFLFPFFQDIFQTNRLPP